MNVKKWFVAAGVVILGVALFFAGTTFAQTDEGDFDRDWSEMMDGEGWEHGWMHNSAEGSAEDVECPYGADHAAYHADHMDGWEGSEGWEEHHGAMHGAYGNMGSDMMGDWGQPESRPAAPSGEPGS